MRCFIGISLEAGALSSVVKLQDSLAKNGYRGNFTAKSNIHITLSFLGEQNEAQVNKICKIMEKIDFSEFLIKISKITNLKDMVILEIDKTKELLSIQKKINDDLIEAGFDVDKKEYYPHITLVRRCLDRIDKEVSIESKINRIILFESKRVDINGKSVLQYLKIYEKNKNE